MIALLTLAFAIDRETALTNAASYAAHSWTMSSANTSASCLSSYESDYTAGTYTGLPYDWGGYMTLEEFDDQIADGYGAGSHSWHGSLWCTAGVDCSGYVSKVWDTDHYATSTFYAVTSEISLSSMERADAFNDAGSHIVLYTYESDAGNPIFYEAAGSASKVRMNSSSSWSYVDGYTPVRFDGIEDGSTTGTVSAPREISSFPFQELHWTAGATSDVIDSYACASDTDESGPEVLYHFSAATAGELQVVVSDDSGVDIDVHVMTAPDGASCLARNDTEVVVSVDAGDVWISLDTWVSGQEYPGPYFISATFTGTVGEPSTEPDDPGDSEPAADDSAPQEDDPTTTPDGADDIDQNVGSTFGPGALVPMEQTSACGCLAGGPVSGLVPVGLALVGLARRRRRGR